MKTILPDTNIFDKLVSDAESVSLIKNLREAGSIRVITSRTVRDELVGSPCVKLLDDLSIEIVGNATPVAGILCAGDFLGAADYFFITRANPTKRTMPWWQQQPSFMLIGSYPRIEGSFIATKDWRKPAMSWTT